MFGTFNFVSHYLLDDASLGGPKRQRGPIQGGKWPYFRGHFPLSFATFELQYQLDVAASALPSAVI
jgi:hypothetical protein